MKDLNFITDEEFRQSLESDDAEIEKCIEVGAWKAVHVLVGSMIEAILADYLLSTEKESKEDLLRMDLGKLVELCVKRGALTSKTEGLSIAVKTYRNLIHPGRVIRLREKVDENGARVAKALLQMIADEISTKKAEKFGFTAEQLIEKILGDSSSLPILGYLLTETSEHERRRLLVKVLPDRYFKLEAHPLEVYVEILPRLSECYRKAFGLASVKLKREVLTKFVSILKLESEHKVATYEDQFFEATDLKYLSPRDRQIVKDHLLSRMQLFITTPLMATIKGIGPYLDPSEASKVVNRLIRVIVYGTDEKLKLSAQEAIVGTWADTESGGKTEEAINKRLRNWVEFLKRKKLDSEAKRCRRLRRYVVTCRSDDKGNFEFDLHIRISALPQTPAFWCLRF